MRQPPPPPPEGGEGGEDATTVNVSPLEVTPLGDGLYTVTEFKPATAMSDAGIAAVSCVPETYVVVRFKLFHRTTDSETNPVPVTVSVKLVSPAVADEGVMVISTGSGIGEGIDANASAE